MPNLYEALLIVTPEADDAGVNAVIGDLRATIEADGGSVLQAGVWERRKLAYQVKGKNEGIYVLIYADGNNTLPAVLKHRMKLDEAVIRSMVLRIEDLQEKDVRRQIAEADHSQDAALAEAQRLAAERRHEAELAATAMTLDEIVAAKEGEAEGTALPGADEPESAAAPEAVADDAESPAVDADLGAHDPEVAGAMEDDGLDGVDEDEDEDEKGS